MNEEPKKEDGKTGVQLNPKLQLGYDALRSKQISYDNLMWQSPLLGITAQSFLYTIAFDSSKSIIAQVITALLGVLLGFASFQLMLKHRYHERYTTDKLDTLETQNGLINVHAKPPKATKANKFYWVINISSFDIWKFALILTTLGGLVALLKSLGILKWLRLIICG